MVLSLALVVLLVIALAVLLPAVALPLLLLPIPRLRVVKPTFLPAGDGNVVRRHTTNMEHE